MDFFEVLEKRRSIRGFDSTRPVKDEDISRILEAARMAPTAGNLQPFKIIVVKTEEGRKALQSSTRQEALAQACVSLVFCVDSSRFQERYGERGRGLYAIQDSAIVCTYAHLTAAALGLASSWIGAFDEMKVGKGLGLTDNLRPVAILPVGYPAKEPSPFERRPMEELVIWK
ncbi:MAG: nitroreductase family protein [bacterium]